MALNTVQDFELRMYGPILENPKVEVEQSDTGSRKVRIHLKTFGGEPYIIPYAAAVTCYIRKTDGKAVWNTCEVADENTVEVTLTTQALACAGKQKAQLYILTDDGDIKSQGFYINVPAAICREDAVESENEFGVLGGMMQDNREIKEAEEERIQAEQERTAAEEERAEAEKRRAQTEQERMAAENERASAEKKRITAEGDRKAAEQARVQAEEQRDIEYQTALTEIDAARASGVSAVQEEGAAQVANVQTAAAEIEADREQIGKNRESTAVDAPGIKRSVSGNPVVLADASEKPFAGMKLYGRSEQFTTTGTQLLDIPAKVQADSSYYTINDDGTVNLIRNDSRALSTIPGSQVLTAGVYIASVTGCVLQIYDRTHDALLVEATTTVAMFTLIENAEISWKVHLNGGPVQNTTPMLNAGTTAHPWEPYTGGRPSPNPEYPQEIVSAGQIMAAGKNLFHIQNVVSNTYVINNGDGTLKIITIESSSGVYAGGDTTLINYAPELKAGNMYTLSAKSTGSTKRIYLTEADFMWYFGQSVELTEAMLQSRVVWYASGNATTADISDIQIELGAEVTSFEPYTGGVPCVDDVGIEVEVKGKNLIPDDVITYGDTSIRCFRYNGGLLLKGGVSYTMSTDRTASGIYFRDYNNWATILSCVYNATELTYTPQQDELVSLDFYFQYGRQDDTTVQLEIGDKATPYEPYHTPQTLSIPTPNGLPGIPVSSEGNYMDENGQQWICDEIDFARGVYVQRIAQRVLDGEENWSAGGLSEDLSDRYWMCNSVTDGINSNYSPVLCTDYRTGIVANNNTVTSQGACMIWEKLRIRDNLFPDVDAWKQHLQEHNVTVMYILNAPIETDLTPEQLAAYKALHTFYPTTIVSAQSGDLDPYLDLEYIADTETYMANEHQKLRDEFDQKLADILALLPAETQAAMIANETNNLLESEELL